MPTAFLFLKLHLQTNIEYCREGKYRGSYSVSATSLYSTVVDGVRSQTPLFRRVSKIGSRHWHGEARSREQGTLGKRCFIHFATRKYNLSVVLAKIDPTPKVPHVRSLFFFGSGQNASTLPETSISILPSHCDVFVFPLFCPLTRFIQSSLFAVLPLGPLLVWSANLAKQWRSRLCEESVFPDARAVPTSFF